MKLSLFKPFVKKTYRLLIVSLIFTLLWAYALGSYTPLFFMILSIISQFNSYDERLAKIDRLKAKGLTEEDIINIDFVKKWTELRNAGIVKYCLYDGAVISGAFLSVFLVAPFFFMFVPGGMWAYVKAGPGNMFAFIGYSYLAGAVLGVVFNRVRWAYNERRFKRLTDPLAFTTSNA